MIKTSEAKNGFFESVATARNPKNAERAEDCNKIDNRNFEKTLNSAKHGERDAKDTKKIKNDKNKVVENVDAAKNSQKIENKEVKIDSNGEISIENKKETVEPKIENANSAISEVVLENAADFIDIDVKIMASENIQSILRAVSEILNIDIKEMPNFDFSAEELPNEVIVKLAEILSIFKELANALLNAASKGEEVEINGQKIQPEEALAIAQYLQQETVKLELSVAELGISEEVAKATSKINPEIQTNSGINIAADLETKTPAQQILPKMLENVLNTEKIADVDTDADANEIKNIIDKLKNALDDTKTTEQNTEKTAAKAVEHIAKSNIEALAGLKKEIVKETPKIETKVANAEVKPVNTEAKSEIKIENIEVKTAAKTTDSETVKTETGKIVNVNNVNIESENSENKEVKETKTVEISSSENKKENSQQNGENKNQKQGQQNAPKENTVLNNEFIAPIKDGNLRATEGNISAPITLDGVAIEANKFSDSSEINAVSPRFVKIFEKEIVEQVQRTILNTANKNGVHQISMTLNPEKLGEIKLTIQVENGVVSARLNVENSEVKSIIEQNLQNLRDALSQQNLSAGNLDVSVGRESAQEMLERMKYARNRKGNFGKEEGVMAEQTLDFGVDTGRRLGTNSFEFFA